MEEKDNHVIQGKWVDCKSAIPIDEMKAIQLKIQQDKSEALKEVVDSSAVTEDKEAMIVAKHSVKELVESK